MLSDPNHLGYESQAGITDFAYNLPGSLGWEDQRSGLKSCIPVAVWNACTQWWCWCIEPPAVYFKFASESFPSCPPELHLTSHQGLFPQVPLVETRRYPPARARKGQEFRFPMRSPRLEETHGVDWPGTLTRERHRTCLVPTGTDSQTRNVSRRICGLIGSPPLVITDQIRFAVHASCKTLWSLWSGHLLISSVNDV